jgi:hypothetical protein
VHEKYIGRVSTGLGSVDRLVLAAICYADENPDALTQRGEHDGWWHVYRIGRIAAHLAPEATGARHNAELAAWHERARVAHAHRKLPRAGPRNFSTFITIARVLAILERRGLVERCIEGPGSRVRLTPAGRHVALLELERHLDWHG